ncbi:conjugal transfer protein [Oceanobacillus oncorhynchi subsp. incaldanensis]|uniref:conjugal transfer protein n=1 Tax=Oceanobacillus oncorhynchi TaxID=545501 RepID=UPI001B0D35B9|nr:conjugal transfer protein [Oceanobacillus oncorhynchi]GIO18469.1 conjugal transfer protein [Oceanobacillus oncorhynchi subsp. incaldanensis]HIS29516.1 conjugal transfer protein [Candidatus Avamphibacillus intestinigallinarum]
MKLPFKKKEKQVPPKKSKKVKVKTVGKRKKSVLILWILLISSLVFAIYKNFTAIDQHTIHEREVVESHIVDTTAIESFTENFIRAYYTWENKSEEALKERTEKLTAYLTEELQALNTEMVREDIPTSSSVQNINIWSVSEETENTFSVIYSVEQKITEDKDSSLTNATYCIALYQDEKENLVIIQNPTLWNSPNKSNFTPDQVNSDDTVGTETMEEVTEFLETFFASYPTATQQELTYYVKNNALPVIEKDYTFSELINPVFQENDNQIKVWVTVKYLDEATKAIQLSQYELTLEKDTNWLIVE